MPRYSKAQLDEWARTPWRDLNAREQSAVRKHMRSVKGNVLADLAEAALLDKPQWSISQAYKVAVGGTPAADVPVNRDPVGPADAGAAAPGEHLVIQSPPSGESVDDDAWLSEPPEDLCERSSARVAHEDFAGLLRTRPGQWRRWRECRTRKNAMDVARRVRAGRLAAFHPAGAYDARAVENPVGVHGVYVSYVGGEVAR